MAFLLSTRGFKVAVLDADIGLANMQVLFKKQRIHFLSILEGGTKH